jgi:ribosomal protein S18 acetylase RimI-like enzyme
MEYELAEELPSVEDYQQLRVAAGLSAKSAEAAARGLAGSWYGVTIRRDESVIGMGRIIGDGGCFFQIVDIAVLPAHQGRGLGRRIMAALMERLDAYAPATALVTLLADGDAQQLYQKFGFELSAPASVGMLRRL